MNRTNEKTKWRNESREGFFFFPGTFIWYFLCCFTLNCSVLVWNLCLVGTHRLFFLFPHYPTFHSSPSSHWSSRRLFSICPRLSFFALLPPPSKNKEDKTKHLPFNPSHLCLELFPSPVCFLVNAPTSGSPRRTIHIKTIWLRNNVWDFTKLASCILVLLTSVSTQEPTSFFFLGAFFSLHPSL